MISVLANRCGIGLSILLYATSAYAEETAGDTRDVFSTGQAASEVLLTLAVVVGLIFLIAYFVRKSPLAKLHQNAHFKVLSVMPVGSKEKVAVVKVGEVTLLLGLGQGQICTLHRFAEGELPEHLTPAESFGSKLKKVMRS